MASLQNTMSVYRAQLQAGAIQQAYRGLMGYMGALRAHFEDCFPGAAVSGSVYAGFMDMTYFSVVPPALKARKLKIAVVFLHEAWRFEIWLSGANRAVQAQWWARIRAAGWDAYRLVPDPRAADAILEHVLAAEPDFGDLDALTAQIEQGTRAFMREIETGLAKLDAANG